MKKNLFVVAISFVLFVSCNLNNGTNVDAEYSGDTVTIVDSDPEIDSVSGVEMIKSRPMHTT